MIPKFIGRVRIRGESGMNTWEAEEKEEERGEGRKREKERKEGRRRETKILYTNYTAT